MRSVQAINADLGNTILFVGSNASERATFARAFETEGFRAVEAADAVTADSIIASDTIDLIVMDGRLAHEDALTFCRKSTVRGGAPIILLAEAADEIDRIVALEVGADNLLSKPVNVRLLLAETRALLRRNSHRFTEAVERGVDGSQGWSLDFLTRDAVSPSGHRIALSPTQASLFGLFLGNPGVVFTAERIVESVGWDPAGTSDSLRTVISRLRRRLQDGGNDAAIRNVRGAGYVFG